MTDARHLHLVPRFPLRLEFFALGRCYRTMGRHVTPHRFCVRRWIGALE